MKFVHSFWSKPLFNNKFDKFENSLKNIIVNYACSLSCIHHHNEKIVLYTDKTGAELLKFLPYDEVIIVDGMENNSTHFAAQIKFEALKRMELGDILIDGDLYLRTDNVINYVKSLNEDVIYSFFEPHEITLRESSIKKHTDLAKILHGRTRYDVPTKLEEFGWFNTSLMKFNSQKLLDEYIEQYEYHKGQLESVDFGNTWPDIIIEQYFLTTMVKENNYSSQPVIENYYYDPNYNQKALDLGFVHLGGDKTMFYNWSLKIIKKQNKKLYHKVVKELNKMLVAHRQLLCIMQSK
jgi:hypothetical protein